MVVPSGGAESSWTAAVAGTAIGVAWDWAVSAGLDGAAGVAALPQATASSRMAPRVILNIGRPCQYGDVLRQWRDISYAPAWPTDWVTALLAAHFDARSPDNQGPLIAR